MLFSGGINALFGLLTNFYLFRGTNRFSIAIATIAFLYAAIELNHWTRRWPLRLRTLLVAGVAIVGLLDQVRPTFEQQRSSASTVAATFDSDKALTAQLERSLAPRSMLFLLPVMEFPEVPSIHHLHSYEPFRPFFFSKDLRFSYGTNKGRAIDGWQYDVARMPAPEMIATLKSYGFAGVLLNRKGYSDGATSIVEAFARIDLHPGFEQGEWVYFGFTPAASPRFPTVSSAFVGSWMPRETAGSSWFHWSSATSGCEIHTVTSLAGAYHVYFIVGSLSGRQVQITLNSNAVKTLVFDHGGEQVVDMSLDLPAGENRFCFSTDRPGVSANNGDPRFFTIFVKDFLITKSGNP